jgi:tRNA U34 5-methylaminomethyl-2-thiouridine-forming methyltransferase MnmC
MPGAAWVISLVLLGLNAASFGVRQRKGVEKKRKVLSFD